MPDEIPRLTAEAARNTDNEHTSIYRKATVNRMYPAKGPLVVETAYGDVSLDESWEGVIGIDDEGFPFPVRQSVFLSTWVEATRRDVISREQTADPAARAEYEATARALGQ